MVYFESYLIYFIYVIILLSIVNFIQIYYGFMIIIIKIYSTIIT
jgi:hypothetical protein